MEQLETTNINIKWLDNIYEQLRTIQDLERMAREGCANLGEYLQIPLSMHRVVIPETRYKNMRFFVLELDILINNLIPIFEGDIKKYKSRLKIIIGNIDNRHLFLKNVRTNNVSYIEPLPFLDRTINLLVEIKSDIIKDIGHILYIKEEDKNKRKW